MAEMEDESKIALSEECIRTDAFFMNEALKLAADAGSAGEVPVGAVVVKDGMIIGRGKNRTEETKNPFAHAEMIAMTEALAAVGGWRLTGCDLYVTLEPCAMCAGAIVHGRIRRVVIGTIMLLVPGLAITNVMRDVISGDFLTAITKFAEVMIVAMAIAIGIAIPIGAARMLFGGF